MNCVFVVGPKTKKFSQLKVVYNGSNNVIFIPKIYLLSLVVFLSAQ